MATRKDYSSEFDDVFEAAAQAYGVDADILKGIAYNESRFRPDIIEGQTKSPAGAIGMMQFMPETAKEYGINPLDPVEAITGAAAYLRKSLDRFNGDYGRAVAAYNWGPNRNAYQRDDWIKAAPLETQNYVIGVLEQADKYKSLRPQPVAQEEMPQEESGILRQAADIPLKLGTGAVQGVRMIADAFGADTATSETLRGVEDYLAGLVSAESKRDSQEIARIMKDAEDKGVGDQVRAALKALAVAPADLVSQGLGTAAPIILGTLGAKVLGAGALGIAGVQTLAGAAMGAGVVKGTIYEETRKALEEAGVPKEVAEQTAVKAQEYGGKNLDQILIGAGIGAIVGRIGIEKSLATRILGGVAGRTAAKGTAEAAAPGLLRRTTTGAIAEGVPEAVQAGQEQIAANIAQQREGLDVPTGRGVAGAATLEGVIGAGIGAGFDLAPMPKPKGEPTARPPVETFPEERPTPQVPGAISQTELERITADYPVGIRETVRRQLSGRTMDELRAIVESNPEILQDESLGAQAIRTLLGIQPGREAERPPAEPSVGVPVGVTGQPGVTEPTPPQRVEAPEPSGVVSGEPATGVQPPVERPIAPTVTETPSGITPPQAEQAAPQGAQPETAVGAPEPGAEAGAAPAPVETAGVAQTWTEMDRAQREQMAARAGLKKIPAAEVSAKPWSRLTKDQKDAIAGVMQVEPAPLAEVPEATAEQEQMPIPAPDMPEEQAALEALEKDRRKILRAQGANLRTALMGTLPPDEVRDISPDLSMRPLQARAGKAPTSLSTLVADGQLNEFLPPNMRNDSSTFDETDSVEYIKERLRNKNHYTFDTNFALEQIGLQIAEIEAAMREHLTLRETNLLIQEAADEQRRIDEEAEGAPAQAAPGTAAQAPAVAPAPELTAEEEDRLEREAIQAESEEAASRLSPTTPASLKAAEDRAKAAEKEAEQARKDAAKAEAEAKKERERREIAERSASAAKDFELGQTAEENLAGQRGLDLPEPAPKVDRKPFIDAFRTNLRNTVPSFTAVRKNGSSLIRPKTLTDKQVNELVDLANMAVDLGMPPQLLEKIMFAGATSMQSVAGIASSKGYLLLGSQWASSETSVKLHGLVHELGHAVDYNNKGPNTLSHAADWRKAHDELRAWYSSAKPEDRKKHPMNYPFLPEFARKVDMRGETYAQAFAYYFTSPADLQANAPTAYAQIQSAIERIQNEPATTAAAGPAAGGPVKVDVQPARTGKGAAVQPGAGSERAGVSRVERVQDRAAEEVITDSAAFKRWFGDSKVVDADGKPLVVYHGTPYGGFASFDPTRSGTRDTFESARAGIYFSKTPRYAGAMSRAADETGPSIYPVYLSIKNPLRVFSTELTEAADVDAMIAEAKDGGHDGIIDEMGNFVVFSPNQIKSATGNRGTFDPEVADITMMMQPENIEERAQRENVFGNGTISTWTYPTEVKIIGATNRDDVIYSLQDKQVDTKRVVEAIRATSKEIGSKWDPYLQETLFHGRTAKQTQDFLNKELEPALEEMRKRGITKAELGEYMHNRHAPEANAVIASRNPRFPDGGSGIKTADARRYMSELSPKKRADLEAAAAKFDQILQGTRDLIVDSRMESPETVEAWEEMYSHYIPLQRIDADYSVNKSMTQGAGYSVSGKTTKGRTGSEREVVHEEILANIAMQRELMIVRAQKNRVAQAVFGLAVQNPNPGFWLALDPSTNAVWQANETQDALDLLREIVEDGDLSPEQAKQYDKEIRRLEGLLKKQGKQSLAALDKLREDFIEVGLDPADIENIMKPPLKPRYDPKTNKVVYESRASFSNPHVFSAKINGSDKFVLFNANNPRAKRMAVALKGMDADALGRTMSMIAKVTRYFAAINTQYNPIFGAYNFLRDVQAALLQITTTPIADKKKQVVAGTGPAMTAIYRSTRATTKKRQGNEGEWDRLWEEFQVEGGQTGFRDQFSQSAERAEALQKMLDPASWAESPMGKVFTANGTLKVPFETARKTIKPVFDWLSDYNTTMENAVRLSAYKVAKEKFLSEGRDLESAKQEAARVAKELTVNFNRKGQVATQMGALYAFFNAAVQGTTRMLQTLRGPAGKKILGGAFLLGSMQALLLAKNGFDEDEPPEFIKERNIIIPYGDGKYVAIPLPLGFNFLPNLSRILTETAIAGYEGRPLKIAKRVEQVAGSFLDMFNPIGNAGWSVQTISPTIADPIVALFENKDWTGKPIAKEDMSGLDPSPGYTRAKESATWLSEQLAYYLNLASGGTDAKRGIISPTPDQLDYLGGQLTGGLGREIGKVVKTIESQITGEELPQYNIPVWGRFFGDITSTANVSTRFYDNITKLNEHQAEIKSLREKRENVQEYFRDNPEARLFRFADTVYRDVSQLRKQRRELVEAGAPKERIKRIEERITNRMRQLNDRVEEAEKR